MAIEREKENTIKGDCGRRISSWQLFGWGWVAGEWLLAEIGGLKEAKIGMAEECVLKPYLSLSLCVHACACVLVQTPVLLSMPEHI